jgi:hypothetical protein
MMARFQAVMATTEQKMETKAPEMPKDELKEVSQDGFDYVLNAMNGEENMKEETKNYKPTQTWTSYFFGKK